MSEELSKSLSRDLVETRGLLGIEYSSRYPQRMVGYGYIMLYPQ